MAKTEKQKIGEIGENAACVFLVKHRHKILDRNYRKKWGEIDIVSQKDGKLRFIEVKTVSRVTEPKINLQNKLIRPTNQNDWFRPEENVHYHKLKRLGRAIQTYLLEKEISDETEWQFDVMAVFLDLKAKKAKIRITENVIL